MASTVSRRRTRVAPRKNHTRPVGSERYLTDAQGKRVAVVLAIDEYRQLVQAREESASLPAAWDWIAAARALRARSGLAPDSTPILRAIREERAR